MRTIARIQNGAGQPFRLPDGVDMTGVLQVYPSGSNYVLIEESDALQASLPAGVTSAPTPYIVPATGSASLYDTPSRGIPTIASVTSTPFSVTRDMFGINIASEWRTLDLTKVGFVRLIDYPSTWKYIEQSAGVYLPAAVAELDALAAACAAAGCKMIFCVDATPASRSRKTATARWLPGTAGAPGAISYATLTTFVNYILNRYGANIVGVESWNEPSVTTSYLDSSGISGVVDFHNTVAAAVSAWNTANSGTIKMVSLTNTGWDGLSGSPANRSVDNLQTASGFANCDVFGYHIYRGGGSTPFDCPINLVRPLQTAQAATAATGKPLWITEFGDSTIAATGANEAYWLRIMLLWFGLGVQKLAPYAWESNGIGNMQVRQPAVSAAFFAACQRLIGSTVSYVNAIHGGHKIAARINGVDLLI